MKYKIRFIKRVFLKIIILFAFFSVFSIASANGASLKLSAPETEYHIGDEIAIDLLLDTKGEDINAIEGNLNIPSGLSVVSFNEDVFPSSMWLEKPDAKSTSFSMVIPGGFKGLIDPFNSTNVKPLVFGRIILKSNHSGDSTVSIGDTHLYLNDGKGTETEVLADGITFKIDSIGGNKKATISDAVQPDLFEVVLSKDEAIFNNQYFIIFNTHDSDSGIDHYEVKEGNGNFMLATSPYLLQDQSLSKSIEVKAVDFYGNERLSKLDSSAISQKKTSFPLWLVGIIAIILGILSASFRKKRKI